MPHLTDDGLFADGNAERRLFQYARNERGARDMWALLLSRGAVTLIDKDHARINHIPRSIKARHYSRVATSFQRSTKSLLGSKSRRFGQVSRSSELHHGKELGGYRFLQVVQKHPRKTVTLRTVRRWFVLVTGVSNEKKDVAIYLARRKAGQFDHILEEK